MAILHCPIQVPILLLLLVGRYEYGQERYFSLCMMVIFALYFCDHVTIPVQIKIT